MLPTPRRSDGCGAALQLLRGITPPPLRQLLPLPPPRLYIIDWGQCGGPTTPERRRQLARLFLALAANKEADSIAGTQPTAGESRIARALRELGVLKPGEEDDGVESRMARGMFDSGGEFIIESKAQQARNAAATDAPQGGVEVLPKDLFLVLRVTQMLRGLGAAAERAGARSAGTLAECWHSSARAALRTR